MATTNSTPKKQLILNAFAAMAPSLFATGLWRHPRNNTTNYNTLKFWVDLAKLLDKANFHALFIADVLGPYDVYKGPGNFDPVLASGAQFPSNDPLYLVPSMAAATENLGFGITASTTYDQPYAHARRFSTVDHLAEGRIAWNIVTSYLESAAKNFGLETQVEHDERYRIAEEYMEVVYKLWEGSWRSDAAIRDTDTGTFAVAGRVRHINHKGKYFSVPGPHITEPSPQRTPFLFQAGTSAAGREFGAKHGEAVFVGGSSPEIIRKAVDDLRTTAKEKHGRDPYSLKILGGVTIIVDETDEKAQEKLAELRSWTEREGALALFGGWTGYDLSIYGDDEDIRFTGQPAIQGMVNMLASTAAGLDGEKKEEKWTKSRIADYLLPNGLGPLVVGSPKTVVDELERWVEVGDLDGFNLSHVVIPGSFEDIVQWVIPELQKRGIFRKEVEKRGATVRETFLGQSHLLDDHPGRKYRWDEGDQKQEKKA
ncbi:luciferase-like domain-containing protein [Dendryphion nanum]|uniref:Luciferase-like domain-containing protein n=1 Tax=Dendryphion nanum TaxID=256645 RepID=A0A9P9DRC3_9PLEO|nr:luciferase-like domain-containing protein [Dendryphion nanum]